MTDPKKTGAFGADGLDAGPEQGGSNLGGLGATGAIDRERDPEAEGEVQTASSAREQAISGGSSQGGPYVGQEKAEETRRQRDQDFEGGQSEPAYHGTGQLGEQATGDQPNSATRD